MHAFKFGVFGLLVGVVVAAIVNTTGFFNFLPRTVRYVVLAFAALCIMFAFYARTHTA
jgi:hypothetical protein